MLTEYKGLKLDRFQQEAIAAINNNYSVIVSAPTGTGKTLVADYLVEKSMSENKKIIYTAPIKALSNQKYKDFQQLFGNEKVGIMTGDVVINPDGNLLIMTTEIFRNQVITNDPELDNVSYVIFDEIHWMNDEDRGTVWEESIILAPFHIKLLGLSATIANSKELAEWISSIRDEKVILVEEYNRKVPLEYYYFTKETGFVSYEELIKFYQAKIQTVNGGNNLFFKDTSHLDLVKNIEDNFLPALFFIFSRKQCAEKAHELASQRNYLKPVESEKVKSIFLEQFGNEDNWSPSTKRLFRVCRKGIAYHHAGLLPAQKTVVEDLFIQRFIYLMYCTETFSVGINYPVKAVCFDSLRKYDGRSFRSLANHEFFQMSGRAGRRGIDEKGYSFAIAELNYFDKEPPPQFDITKLEPLASQFRLSYNTVLNLSAALNEEQIMTFFRKSFASHSYKVTSQKIRNKLASVYEESDQIKEKVCHRLSSFKCPIDYYPKRKELDKLKRTYKKLDPKRKNKVYARHMLHKIKKWDKILKSTPQKCSPKQQALCKSLSGKWQRLQEESSDLNKQLTMLPDHNTFLNEFSYKKAHLEQLDYMNNEEILPRGALARYIYVQELLVTELVFSGLLAELDDDQLSALISCIDYEAKKNDLFGKNEVLDFKPIKVIIRDIQSICGYDAVRFDHRVAVITYFWSKGAPFTDIQQLCNLDEGDIVAVFRRTIDLLRQMREAVNDPNLKERLKTCMKKIDRDEASIMEF